MLVLKTIGMRPAESERLGAIAGGRRDVLILNRHMSPIETASLIAACDCYVSLHRAEGFGLTVAEAMFFARPVICTGYSGVLDFASDETAFLVPFPAGTLFAEPNLDQAAMLMRRAFSDRETAAARASRASASVKTMLSPDVVGRRMKDLIEARLRAKN